MTAYKFRAWDNTLKQMLPWEELIKLPKNFISALMGKNTLAISAMLFTGYKDVNGVEVYAGDILLRSDGEIDDIPQYWLVEFEHGAFWLDGSMIYDYSEGESYTLVSELTVAGNLYENRDLLPEWKLKELEGKK